MIVKRYGDDTGEYTGELFKDLRVTRSKKMKKWHFRPRTFWPFVLWSFSIFLGVKLLLLPLTEGVYSYLNKAQQVKELKAEYKTMQEKLTAMRKLLDYMKTPAYIEEKGHQIGLIKSNEAPMVVVDSPDGASLKKEPRKDIEIGN
jgi:cell division protein FtsB